MPFPDLPGHARLWVYATDRPLTDAEEANEGVSGCGIDASVQVLEDFAEETGLDWVSGLDVLYRDAKGHVKSASRPAFQKQAAAGTVDAATPVFDLSVETVAALREGRFEHPAGQGWHAEAFPLATA